MKSKPHLPRHPSSSSPIVRALRARIAQLEARLRHERRRAEALEEELEAELKAVRAEHWDEAYTGRWLLSCIREGWITRERLLVCDEMWRELVAMVKAPKAAPAAATEAKP